tara:strand:- start:269 stop:439 length:171 start_codon:yes stop_codon:yes gene_type:complete
MTDKEEYNTVIEDDDECDHEHGVCTDEAHGYHWARCRGCGKMGNCSNDDGWCMDCN